MTQEEKARAYDEALEKAKIEINTKGIGETVNLCYQLFPQLAENDDEESEDERIRKRLIEYFEGFRMGNAEVRWEGLIVQEVLAWLKKQKECVADNSKTSTDEDERIINQLITLVNSAGEVLLIPTNKEELVAWLNKYKESLHIPETCKENANSFADGIIEVRSFQRGMEEGRKLEKQNEHKPQTDDEKEYIRTIKSIISDFIRDKKPENLAYYQRIYDWLDGRHVPISCGHENGFMSKEWSEEDEKMLRTIISDGSRGVELDSKQIFWLKSLRPQPKLEWSEEDKKILNHLIDKVQENWHIRMPNGHYFGISNDEKETFSSWLRHLPERFNLQPKQEWGEDDEAILSWCISDIERAKHSASQTKPELCDIEIHWLKSLKPRWKPSEEQMEALKSTIVDVAKFSKRGGRQVELENEPYYSALHSLYCNLEKLM